MRRAQILPMLLTHMVILAMSCRPVLCAESTGDPAFSIAEAKEQDTYLGPVECSPKSIDIDGKKINIVSSWLQRVESESDYQRCHRGNKRYYYVCFTLDPRIAIGVFAFRQNCSPDNERKASTMGLDDTGQYKNKPRIVYAFMMSEEEKASHHITAAFKGHSKTTMTFAWAK